MKHHLVICLWAWGISMVFPMPLSAQALTTGQHVPCRTDSLWAYKLPYVSVTDSGQNCVWDFSYLPTDSAETISIDYYAPTSDTSRVGLHREHTNYYYHFAQDTLWLTGYENATTHVLFTKPISQMRFPFAYRDTVSGSFTGKGQYCHAVPFQVEGGCFALCDAIGEIKLPDVVSDSALRIHTIRQYVAIAHDTSSIREDTYRWYDNNVRHPLFETTKITVIGKTDTTEMAIAYYIPQEKEKDNTRTYKPNPIIQEPTDSLATNILCLPNPVQSDLHISYQLVRNAEVYVSIHFNGGISMYSTSIQKQEAGQHQTTINMAAYPTGTYVVYLHVDDVIYVQTIIKL